MIELLILLWPYLLLAIFVWNRKRRGVDAHDRTGFIGAGVSLGAMTAGLVIGLPFADSNIGGGIVFFFSFAYCYLFLVAGYEIGRWISLRKARRRMSKETVTADAPPPSMDPFAGLPQSAMDRMDQVIRSASILATGLLVSIFFFPGFLFILGLVIIRSVQARSLLRQFPMLGNPYLCFSGKTKREVNAMAKTLPHLKKALEFSAARRSYRVAVLFFILLCAGMTWMIVWMSTECA